MSAPGPTARRGLLTRRGLLLLGAQLGVAGGLGARMRQLQVEEGEKYRLLAEENRVNIRLIPPERGLILDRTGAPLAVNRQNYRVVLVREQAGDAAAVLARLARLIPLPPERRERVLEEARRRAAFVPVTVAEHLSWDELARVAANAPALPGITPEVGLTRHYPHAGTTAHVVGYVGPVTERDLQGQADPDPLLQIPDFQIGKTGVEARREPALRGTAGTSRIEVNALGRVMRELDRREGTPGADLHLTLDIDLQSYAMERMQGQSAATVVMDVATGGILASASSPGFDPNAFVFGIGHRPWNALLNDPYRPLSNKAVSGAYPPGSTYKMVVALAALEKGVISPSTTSFCPGYYQLGNRRFHCWRRGGHGHVNLRDALKGSCDVYFYETARETGIDAISDMANRLGIGVRHELPLPAITAGLTPTQAWKRATRDEGWRVGDTLNAGIGQGFVLASPLQMAVMTARIATGRQIAPRLVHAVNGAPQPVAEAPPLDIPASALAEVRDGMDAVVNDRRGTAWRARIADEAVQMAGKTGTSQVRNFTAEERARGIFKNEDLPWNRRDHALFVAYAPQDAPRYAVATVVEHGGGGSTTAAPIVRDVMMRALYGPRPPLAAYPPEERRAIEERRAAEPEPQSPARPATGSDRA